MGRLQTSNDALRERALALAAKHGIDPSSWFLQVLIESRKTGSEPDLGALVRTYWELQRVTGRADLHAEWRSLADSLGHGDAG